MSNRLLLLLDFTTCVFCHALTNTVKAEIIFAEFFKKVFTGNNI